MIKSTVQFITVDLVGAFGIIFLLIYISATKNILDIIYLFFIIVFYFRIKFYQWKKYH